MNKASSSFCSEKDLVKTFTSTELLRFIITIGFDNGSYAILLFKHLLVGHLLGFDIVECW